MKTKGLLLLLAASAFGLGELNAQCTPVATIDQNFDNFVTFPDSCWSANGTPSMTFTLTPDTVATGKILQFYGSTSIGVPFYLVTPELSTIDGDHFLSFDAKATGAPALGVKIQIGTLDGASNYASFVPHGNEIVINDTITSFTSINIPADTNFKFVTLRLTTIAPHQAILLDNFKWQEDTTAAPLVCDPVSTINQGFDNFTAFPDSCWTTSSSFPSFYLEDTTANNFVTFYSGNSVNLPFYMTMPELNTIDGNHVLKFKAAGITPGDVKIQIGTLEDANNYASFVAHGNEMVVNGTTQVEYTSIIIPANVAYKFVTLQITATTPHQAIALDDFIWEELPTSIGNINKEENAIKIYPNPVSKGILTIESDDVMNKVVIMDATGKTVKTQSALGNKAVFNMDHFANGLYFIQVNTNKTSFTKRFIKQ